MVLYLVSTIISTIVIFKHMSKEFIEMNAFGALFLLVSIFLPYWNILLSAICLLSWRKNERF